MVVVINVDACPFLGFSEWNCHPEDTRVSDFWLVTCCPCSTSLWLLPMWILLHSLGVICYDMSVLSEGQKITSRICLMNSQSTFLNFTSFYINELVILSKAYKPDNFESQNSLKRRLTNIQGLYINFIGWVFFLESNYPDILA